MLKPATAIHSLIVIFTLFLLTACGGSSNKKSSPKLLTGTITLAGQPINNLTYTTATQSGQTSATGEFQYMTSEQVVFSLAGIEFANVAGIETLTMANLEADSLPSSYADFERYRQQLVKLAALNSIGTGLESISVSNTHVSVDGNFYSHIPVYANPKALDRLNNRLFLLYSLDGDNDADNGIQLPLINGDKDLSALSNLPISLNTFEYIARMQSRAKLIDYNKGHTGFSALAKFLKAKNITISYPEEMCYAGSYNLNSWTVNYKNSHQQPLLNATTTECAAIPTFEQAADFAEAYITDGKISNLYQYDAQQRLVARYRKTTGEADGFETYYKTGYSTEDDLQVTFYQTFQSEISATPGQGNTISELKKIITKKTAAGLITSIFTDNLTNSDSMENFSYNSDNTVRTRTHASSYESACSSGKLDEPSSTTTYSYDINGLLKLKNQVEICPRNTYQFDYNELGQTLSYKHNTDAKTDNDPNTISYEHEHTASFKSGDITSYTTLSRFGGLPTNNERQYVYGYNDDLLLNSTSQASIQHPDGSVSTSVRQYKYDQNKRLSESCYGDDCSRIKKYLYHNNGLIKTTLRYDGEQLLGANHYFYNEQGLILSIKGYQADQLTEDFQPIEAADILFENNLEYLPSMTPSLIKKSGVTTYYKDPNKDPNKDNSIDEHGYYQWFDLDLAEHLNRTMTDGRNLDSNED